MRSLAALALLAGCDRVYGLESRDVDDPLRVTGLFEIRRVVNTPDGVPEVVHELVPASRLTFGATLADGSPSEVAYDDATGTFSFELAEAGQAYRLLRSLDGQSVELQASAHALHLVANAAGRADALSVTVPTPVTFTTGETVSSDYLVATTGAFASFDAGVVTSPFTFDWNTPLPGNARLSLLDASKGDRAYVVRFTDSSSQPTYTAATAAFEAQVTLANGAPAKVGGTLSTVAPTCMTITANRATEDARLLAQLPDTYNPYTGDWRAIAVAGADIGSPVQIPLAIQGEGTPTNQRTVASFIDPIPGTSIVASIGIAHSRSVALGNATPTTVPLGIRYLVPIVRGGDCDTNNVVASGALGYAKFPTLAGTLLDHDVTAAAAGDVTLSWPTDLPTDSATVSLFEVADTGTTTLLPIAAYTTADTEIVIGSGVLATGHSYMFRFDTQTGFPAAKDGDFGTVVYPVGNATSWSHVVTIQ